MGEANTPATAGEASMKGCYFCAETGLISDHRAAEINAGFGGAAPICFAGRCLCTVTWAEMAPHVVSVLDGVAHGERR